MGRGLLLSSLLAMASIGECARAGSERLEEEMEAETEQTQDEGVRISMAAPGGPNPWYDGCAYRGWHDKGSAYPILCSAMSGNGWECEPRTLDESGTLTKDHGPNEIVEDVFCPELVYCSCQKDGHSGNYEQELCQELMGVTIDHQPLLQQIEQEFCPAFAEACAMDCGSSWVPSWVQTKEKCVEKECSVGACLDDFPRWNPDFMKPYGKKDVGCWGRLRSNDTPEAPKKLTKVLHTIIEYESLAKCCFHPGNGSPWHGEGGAKEFKWMSGSELVTSMNPLKHLIGGYKVCNAKEGWHSASHVGDGSTQAKCESLQ